MLNFRVKTNIKVFKALMPLKYVKLFWICLFVIYLLMSYSLFGNSFYWELVFYKNQSIHFFVCMIWLVSVWCRFSMSSIRKLTEDYICLLRSFACLWYNLSHSHTFFYYWCFELSRGFPFICFRCRLA